MHVLSHAATVGVAWSSTRSMSVSGLAVVVATARTSHQPHANLRWVRRRISESWSVGVMAADEGHQEKLLDEEYGEEKLGSTTGFRHGNAQRC